MGSGGLRFGDGVAPRRAGPVHRIAPSTRGTKVAGDGWRAPGVPGRPLGRPRGALPRARHGRQWGRALRGRAGPAARDRPTLAAPWGIVQTADGFCTWLHKRRLGRETGPTQTGMRNRAQRASAGAWRGKSGMPRAGSAPVRANPARKRTALAQGPSLRAGRAPPRPRRVRWSARPCSGSMNMIMMRTWATAIRRHPSLPRTRACEGDGTRRRRPAFPYPQARSAGFHTGPIHRPC